MNDQSVMELLQKFQANITNIEFAYTDSLAAGQNDLDLNSEFPQFIKVCESTVNENLMNLEQFVQQNAFQNVIDLGEFYDMLIQYGRW